MSDDHTGRAIKAVAEDFKMQDIIRDRKVERRLKVEQKRKADLQRIRDMGSIRRKESLQKLLIQILKLEVFQSFMNKKELRELRSVSERTRHFMDRHLEEKLLKRVRENDTPTACILHLISFRLSPCSEFLLARLLSSFTEGENPAKRFFQRSLSVSFAATLQLWYELFECDYYDDQADDELQRARQTQVADYRNRFAKKVNTLLQMIGDQIWHFQISVEQLKTTPISLTSVYTILQRWLSLMPNLKWLEICIDDSKETIKTEDKKSVARALTQKNPLPRLKFLERLSLLFSYDWNLKPGQMEIFEVLLRTNPQIKILDIVGGDDSKLQHLPKNLIKSLPLTSISVSSTREALWGAGLNFTSIQSIINLDWQLKSVALDLDMAMAGTNLHSVFIFLENFPTLEQVNLNQLYRLKIGKRETLGYLKLPNLKDLSLTNKDPVIEFERNNVNVNHFYSLQFLLHCKNLRALTWSLFGIDDQELRRQLQKNENPQERIDFRAGLRFLYESIVWDVFPYLETVNVTVGSLRSNKNTTLYANCCTHDYRRASSERNWPPYFLMNHSCSRKHKLENCVALLE